MTRTPAPPLEDFASLAEALNRHAGRLARACAAERRAKDRQLDARWRSPRLLWPDFTGER